MSPVSLRAYILQEADKLLLLCRGTHDGKIRTDGKRFKSAYDFFFIHKRGICFFCRFSCFRYQIHRTAQRNHIVFKILQLRIYPGIPFLFSRIHVVKLTQNHFIGFIQTPETNPLFSILVINTFHPKIRIDEKQTLCRQIFQLQIPDGMIGGDISDCFQLMIPTILKCIIVMKIGNPPSFFRSASIFSDIMHQSSSGHQTQIYRNSFMHQLSCHKHGYMMYSGDMSQCFIRSAFLCKAHKHINSPLIKAFLKTPVFTQNPAVRFFFFFQKSKMAAGIKRQLRCFPHKQFIQNSRKIINCLLCSRNVFHRIIFRKILCQKPLKCIIHPSLFRSIFTDLIHIRLTETKYLLQIYSTLRYLVLYHYVSSLPASITKEGIPFPAFLLL